MSFSGLSCSGEVDWEVYVITKWDMGPCYSESNSCKPLTLQPTVTLLLHMYSSWSTVLVSLVLYRNWQCCRIWTLSSNLDTFSRLMSEHAWQLDIHLSCRWVLYTTTVCYVMCGIVLILYIFCSCSWAGYILTWWMCTKCWVRISPVPSQSVVSLPHSAAQNCNFTVASIL